MPGADRRGQEHQSGDLDASEHQSGILVAKKARVEVEQKMILHMYNDIKIPCEKIVTNFGKIPSPD